MSWISDMRELPTRTFLRHIASAISILAAQLVIPADHSFPQCVTTRWSSNSEVLQAVSFSDSNHGIVVGNNGLVLWTSDGGSSWMNTIVIDSLTNDFIDVAMTDSNNAVALGRNGEIFLSHDGGNTWMFQVRIPHKNLNKMVFSDQKNGTIVGGNGIMLKSNDGEKAGL